MAWPDFLEATSAASVDDLNIITQFNSMLEESMDQEQGLTALTTRVADLEEANAGGSRGLRIVQSATSPQTDFRVYAERFVLSDGATALSDVSVLIDIGDAGAGGLDTGTLAADTPYYVHICHDSTGAMSPETVGVISASTVPTLPTGYDKYGLVFDQPVILTDSTPELVTFSHIPDCGTIRFYSLEEAGHSAAVTLTADDSWREMDLSTLVPVGASGAWCMFRFDCGLTSATSKLYMRPNWGSAGAVSGAKTIQRVLFSSPSGVDQDFGPFWVPLDENGIALYRAETPGGTPALSVWVVGWQVSEYVNP